MKVIIVALLIALAVADPKDLFRDFQQTYEKTYSAAEFAYRFQVFSDNLEIAAGLHEQDPTATYGVTKFMDLTPEEFSRYYLLPKNFHRNIPAGELFDAPENVDAPSSFDWRSKGAITPVYNQAQCGSCWAFSATETMESYYQIGGKTLTKLSMQQVVDCDTTAYGCNGGWTYAAYNYIKSAGGQDSYASYPYVAHDQTCKFSSSNIVAHLESWKYVTQSAQESVMQDWVASSGPLSVCVDAASWQTYTGGVISNCGKQIDHCVQVTGYETFQGTAAWNVRNSWGTNWGYQGYLYVARGNDVCAIGQVVTAVKDD